MGTVNQHQLSTFSTPVNGTTPIDANTVRGNDNTIKSSYNTHDADATIHLQSGAASARPAQGTAGQTWLATDSGAVYLSIDNGSAWVDINYIRSTATSLPANVLSSSLTGVGVLAGPHMTAPVVDSGGITVSAGTSNFKAIIATDLAVGTDPGGGQFVRGPSARFTNEVVAGNITFTGATPGALSDGMAWYDGTNIKCRLGGVTKTFTVS